MEKIWKILKVKEYIIFSYIFGSFASMNNFNDIDFGIFSSNLAIPTFKLELQLETELDHIIHILVDIRIINDAPLSFIYNILKNGFLIIDKKHD